LTIYKNSLEGRKNILFKEFFQNVETNIGWLRKTDYSKDETRIIDRENFVKEKDRIKRDGIF
jgi:hypothetical protein